MSFYKFRALTYIKMDDASPLLTLWKKWSQNIPQAPPSLAGDVWSPSLRSRDRYSLKNWYLNPGPRLTSSNARSRRLVLGRLLTCNFTQRWFFLLFCSYFSVLPSPKNKKSKKMAWLHTRQNPWSPTQWASARPIQSTHLSTYSDFVHLYTIPPDFLKVFWLKIPNIIGQMGLQGRLAVSMYNDVRPNIQIIWKQRALCQRACQNKTKKALWSVHLQYMYEGPSLPKKMKTESQFCCSSTDFLSKESHEIAELYIEKDSQLKYGCHPKACV